MFANTGRFRLVLKVLGFNLLALAVVVLLFEWGLRYTITYNPSYYVGTKAVGSCIPHPYGEVCFNSLGYPDDEFNLASTKPRVGYFGDSNCYGVGSGRRHRITEHLKVHYQEYEHFNFCYIGGDPLVESQLLELERLAEEYRLSYVIYLMSLNDIPPLMSEVSGSASAEEHGRVDTSAQRSFPVVKMKEFITPVDNVLRGRSYLYTFLRTKIKERLNVAGYGHDGYETIEQFPEAHREVFAYATSKINRLGKELRAKGVHLIVVPLPYEMQVSSDAAETYRRMKFRWEPGFEQDGAQKMLAIGLDSMIPMFDPYYAFDGYWDKARVGEYFVYNEGDKIDWAHPNRQGTKLIAEYLIKHNILPREKPRDPNVSAHAGSAG